MSDDFTTETRRQIYTSLAAEARKRMAHELKAKYAPKPVPEAAPAGPDTGLDAESLATLEKLVGG